MSRRCLKTGSAKIRGSQRRGRLHHWLFSRLSREGCCVPKSKSPLRNMLQSWLVDSMSTHVSTDGTSHWAMGTFQAFCKVHVLVLAREVEKV